MPPHIHRCLCTVHKCKDKIDASGNAGIMVDARKFRQHQQDEKNAVMHKLATQKQEEILRAQESSLSTALNKMTVEDAATAPGIAAALPEAERYHIDKIRQMVLHIGDLKDELAALRAEVASIGEAPTAPVDDHVMTDTLLTLYAFRESAADLKRRLSLISRRSKASSVVSLRDEMVLDIYEFNEFVGRIESSWEMILASREAQRVTELESGATEYDSGKTRMNLGTFEQKISLEHAASHFINVMSGARPIIQLATLMVVACNVILGLSRRGCSWLFSMTQFIIQSTVMQAVGSEIISTYFQGLLSGFPKDVRAATEHFKLEAKATVYAVCPKCHATYKPTFEGSIPFYREQCNSRLYGSRCGELIVRPKLLHGHRVNVPIRSYVAFDFKDWVASLLARPGYETMMDGAWEKMALSSDGKLKDIFQGSTIRSFKGPDKQTHFKLAGGDGAGRYLFSLAYDSFNPLRVMAAGKKLSIGMISLVCLNLPIELRYEPENMFLAGIVPGPHEPPLDAINPYLRPIVDSFIEFWEGVRLTRTYLCQLGRLILCALIVVICDSPAARKVGGFASFGQENFCTFCRCTKTEHTYGSTDIGSWRNRTNEECRIFADRFRNATSAKAAASTFDKTGMRWSELLRLPYYDPSRFLVVDPMHSLFLGLIKEHFQGILGYRKSSPSAPMGPSSLRIPATDLPTNPLPKEKAPRASVRRLISWLEPLALGDFSQVDFDALVVKWGKSSIHVVAFVYVGRLVGCLPPTMGNDGRDRDPTLPFARKMTKTDLAKALLTWRRGQVPDVDSNDKPPINAKHGSVFTTEEMETLWDDLVNVVKPTWVTSVPTTLSSSGPKLKSDQWRMVGSLFLPITLIRLWSTVDPDDEDSKQRHELLNLTMLLLSAVAVASSRVTSANNAAEFLKLMLEYLKELQRLFPDYKCHSIHHMAFHIKDFLLMYGPVHGWWAFPFERMIGTLQRIPTNHKPGEYEETIGRSWHRRSKFRAFFKGPSCPEVIRHCANYFDTLVRPQSENSLAMDSQSSYDDSQMEDDYGSYIGSTEPVTPTLRAVFREALGRNPLEIPESAQSFTHIRHGGTAYSTHSRHEGNSGVLFADNNPPCCIEKILQFPPNANQRVLQGTWVIVRPYRPARVSIDPYRAYPRLRMRMWDTELGNAIAMPISAINSHFAKLVIPWEDTEVAVVASLSRVLLV